ncbi:hypothetical protein [Zunongwangia pacifica]|uniref:DUF3575 domain-containing protein n=1 Tax=Zunongwangia pacifica TaxID=2911062 RepID=A0A9X1ZZ89_9FLAO|nr:hypothetical protein [Zunongwangia pacifica]MCL6219785.1 hypothetical protein [Zunongwangia pacifica]
MKKVIVLFLFLVLGNSNIKAQNYSVEKSLYGVQTGVLGVWGYNELRLADEFSFRTELGLDGALWANSFFSDGDVHYLLAPVITLEPRWYYNLNKRADRGRKTWNNAANFLSLDVSLHPDLFVISDRDHVGVPNQISFITKWGIKRNIGKHFGYEFGIGFGYGSYFNEKGYYDSDGTVVSLDLKIGYNF